MYPLGTVLTNKLDGSPHKGTNEMKTINQQGAATVLGAPRSEAHEVLGIDEGERDLRVIEEAALQRMTLARAQQLIHPEESTRLQNQVAQALLTLTDRARSNPPIGRVTEEPEVGLALLLCQDQTEDGEQVPTLWKVRLTKVPLDDRQKQLLTSRIKAKASDNPRVRALIIRRKRERSKCHTELLVALRAGSPKDCQ
jgi:hypothetical protein